MKEKVSELGASLILNSDKYEEKHSIDILLSPFTKSFASLEDVNSGTRTMRTEPHGDRFHTSTCSRTLSPRQSERPDDVIRE